MATFGEIINLQPYILEWLVNGDYSDLAYREIASEKATKDNKKKVTYRGKYNEFLDNYLKPSTYKTVNSTVTEQPTPNSTRFNGIDESISCVNLPIPAITTSMELEVKFVVPSDMLEAVGETPDYLTLFNSNSGIYCDIDLSPGDNGGPITSESTGFNAYLYNKYTSGTNIGASDNAQFTDVRIEYGAVNTVKAVYPDQATPIIYFNDVEITDTSNVLIPAASYASNTKTHSIASYNGQFDFFYGDLISLRVTVDSTDLITVSGNDFVNLTNGGTWEQLPGTSYMYFDPVGADVKYTNYNTNFYPDRLPRFTRVSKRKLLSSLIEYKNRWNINEDSATLKIDFIGFKGDWLVVKTTEDR
jgi:hypothetical protein